MTNLCSLDGMCAKFHTKIIIFPGMNYPHPWKPPKSHPE